MANFISSNTYDPTHVDTSAKWRPEVATFPYSNASDFEEESESEEIDDIVSAMSKKYKEQESGDYYRGDTQSFGRSFHGIAYESINHRSGISPIAGLYKNMDGPPIGTGGSGQAFRTTGMIKRTGTIDGYAKGNVKSKKNNGGYKLRLKDFFEENLETNDYKLLENFFLRNQCFFNF